MVIDVVTIHRRRRATISLGHVVKKRNDRPFLDRVVKDVRRANVSSAS
jgi:hypothetical protein